MQLGIVKVSISKKKLVNGNYHPDKVSIVGEITQKETNDFYESASEILAHIYKYSERM